MNKKEFFQDPKEKGIFKFNNGLGAKLCNGCRKIIREGEDLEEEDRMVMKGKVKNGPEYVEYCGQCKRIEP